MNNLKNKLKDWFFYLPIRIKLLLVSGLVLSILVLTSNYFLNIYSELSLKDQVTASSKKTVNLIAQLLNNNLSQENLGAISKIDFIEKISVTKKDGSQMYAWDSKDYFWNQLKYFKMEFPGNAEVKDISIAINHEKYMASNKLKPSNFNKYSLYITSLIMLLIILIVNLLIIVPIDSISNELEKYSDGEDEHDDDDKSISEIIELSKTIGALKRSISQRKEKEIQLVAIQMRLSSVLNTIGDAIITINKDSNIVMVNPAFERIWGHSKVHVIGKKLEEMMPEKYRDSHKAGLERYLATGVEHVINQNLELEALHANGTVFPIEIHISETRINDALFFTAAIRDITQRKKIEQELLDAKENVEEMLETRTHDLVTRLNELNCLYGLSKLIEEGNKNISHILKETLVLITTACKFTDNVCCLIYYDGHEYRTKNYKESKWKLKQDIKIKDKVKGHIILFYLEENYPDTNNQFLKYEESLLDIVCIRLSRYLEHNAAKEELETANQALREAQMQLIQAEKLDTIGTLSAGVAHEVKNPLAVIQLGVDYLNKKSFDDGNIKEVIHEMDDAIRRADSVIKELVNFSASSDLTLEILDVNQLIDDSLSLVKHEILKNNININKNYSENLAAISGDKQKLGQVIINLVINAIHAMENSVEKTLKIRTFPSIIDDLSLEITGKFNLNDTIAVISIEDTGTGIEEEKLSKLFDPFFTTKPSGKGTGLGLTVCQNIIRLHGGSLEFENAKTGGAIAKLFFKV
jgi:PAS domain S-box-containing protein